MASKTRMTEQVKVMDYQTVAAGLDETPSLIDYRDDRGRNWLHLAASVDLTKKAIPARDSVRMARMLLSKGIDINSPAFTEGSWQATPLWYAVARGSNFALAKFLLSAGSSPEHCLWAASFGNDEAMLKLLIDHGAQLEAIAENETPLLGAVKYSKFVGAKVLLQAGADPDYIDITGKTALHYMLKKGTDLRYFKMFVDHGARGDIPGPDGRTAAQIMSRKRDPGFHELAAKLAVGQD